MQVMSKTGRTQTQGTLASFTVKRNNFTKLMQKQAIAKHKVGT